MPTELILPTGIIFFLYGILIGSFLNVCIYRIPKKEDIVTARSHCMQCGYQLKWYDLIPIFSYLFLGGKCRNCKCRLSMQYPLVEAANGLLYVLIFTVCGFSLESVLYCFMASALLVLSFIDEKTQEIPAGINLFLLLLGVIHLITDWKNWPLYLIGLFAVSLFLVLLMVLSQGGAMGGGDVKLMAAAGLLLGWKLIILSFVLGCVIGSIVHIARMKLTHASRTLAFGPYLSIGILLSALWGSTWIQMYLNLLLSGTG